MSGTWRTRFRRCARALQQMVLVTLLAVMYVIGFGVLWLSMKVFNRRSLLPDPPGWSEVTRATPEEPECNHPS